GHSRGGDARRDGLSRARRRCGRDGGTRIAAGARSRAARAHGRGGPGAGGRRIFARGDGGAVRGAVPGGRRPRLNVASRDYIPAMLFDALLAYAHFVSIFLTGLFLVLEWIRCREPVEAPRARLLARMDVAYFVAALAALATGLLRAVYGDKGAAFYFSNPVFHAKLGAYVLDRKSTRLNS